MPKQNVAVEIFIDGVWTDLVTSAEVLADQSISIMRGDGSESNALRPSSITMRLNNNQDKFRITNPLSSLYGKAGVNTPIRVSVNSIVRGIGEITSWSCGQTRDFRVSPRRGKAWTDIEANGIFWRINQWTENVQSTMIKGMLSFSSLSGAWPLEDERDSTILTNVTAGGNLGSYSGTVDLGDSEKPDGAEQSLKLGSTGQVTGAFITTTNSGWQISFAVHLTAIPGSATFESIFEWYDSVGRHWVWKASNLGWAWDIFDGTGTLIDSNSSGFGSASPDSWVRCRMKVSVSGSTLTWEPAWYAQGQSSPFGTTDTFSSTTTGSLTRWNINALTYNIDANYTSVFGLNNATDNIFNAGVIADFNGHTGETTAERFDRLFNDLNISHAINGSTSAAMRMGPQPVATLAEILREIRDTEDGLLFESKSGITPVFNTRAFRYNNSNVFTLDVSAVLTGLPELPEEVTNDLPIHNIVTATNRAGGSVTAEDSSSVMGSQAPPNGRGEYRQTVNISVEKPSTTLLPEAHWWLKRGTVNLPAYPQVTVLASALSPAKLAEIEDPNRVTIGTVIEITNYREYTIRLYILGYTEIIGTHRRTFVFTCLPDQQFVVGKYDDTSKRYDLRTSTLNANLNSTDTLVSLNTVSSREQWSSDSTPYNLILAGEVITAWGMSAKGSIAVVDGTFEIGIGSGWYSSGATTPIQSAAGLAHTGSYSAQITVSGSPSEAKMRNNMTVAASPTQTFRLTMWVFCTISATALAIIDYYGSGGYLTSDFSSMSISANTWTKITLNSTAPASTTRIEYGPSVSGSPANGTIIRTDDIDIVRTDTSTGRQLAAVGRDTNGITKSHTSGEPVNIAPASVERWAL